MPTTLCPSCDAAVPQDALNETGGDCPRCGFDLLFTDYGDAKGLPLRSWLAMIAVALAGVAIWALVAHRLQGEVVWLIWVVALAIGIVGNRTGAEGRKAALVAAGIAILAYAGGRAIMIQQARLASIESWIEADEMQTAKTVMKVHAEQWALADRPEDDAGLRAFLSSVGLSPEGVGGTVSDQDLQRAKEQWIPRWKLLQGPAGEQAVDQFSRQQASENFTYWDLAKKALGPTDLLMLIVSGIIAARPIWS